MEENVSRYHSVQIYEERCKGCTICVTTCPVEAIRVHRGKAHIIEERCIDCGECIRRCPSKAKYTLSPELKILTEYEQTTVLIPPTFYAQFPENYTVPEIRFALRKLKFTFTTDIAQDAIVISKAAADFLTANKIPQKPVISSSCPAVIKLIQRRFPALTNNILPFIPPVEHAARRIRKKMSSTAVKNGIFFISPCPAKITAARRPTGYAVSQIDNSFTISSIYLPVLSILKQLTPEESEMAFTEDQVFSSGTIWCCESGEAQCINKFIQNTSFKWISASGIAQVIETLEAIEDGQLNEYDFVELATCIGGCIGGSLTITSIPQAHAITRVRLAHETQIRDNAKLINYTDTHTAVPDIRLTEEITPLPVHRLSNNFAEARKRMERIEEISKTLPGLDCGSCGAPNCRTLAEDIVCGSANLEDCVIIMKQKYEEYLFGKYS